MAGGRQTARTTRLDELRLSNDVRTAAPWTFSTKPDRNELAKYQGTSFDCGSKVGFLTANVVYALDRDDIREGFLAELRKLDIAEHLDFSTAAQ